MKHNAERKDLAAVANKPPYSVKDFPRLKVAVVHYWFMTWRGGEKVVQSLLKLFPQADIYTLFHDPELCRKKLPGYSVYSSLLDIPLLRSHYQRLFPLYPIGVRSLKLRKKYDLILSSESGPAKGIKNPEAIPHLCYIHTPMRYCWGFTDDYLNTLPSWMKNTAKREFERLRKWDLTTVANVDRFVANSRNVAERVKNYYGKEAGICYPPIAPSLFEARHILERKKRTKEYYLSFGAITPYKKIDLLVETFKVSNNKLIVIGTGSEKERLEKTAPDNITFTGALKWSEIREVILGAKALIFPGEEDFGMVPLEVMAMGTPVIAYGAGGATETVVENLEHPEKATGMFFFKQTVDSLLATIEKFEQIEPYFSPEHIQSHAKKFIEVVFLENISKEIVALLNRQK